MTNNISEELAALGHAVEKTVLKSPKNMVGLGSVLVAESGYSRKSDHSTFFLTKMFEAAGKPMPTNLTQTSHGNLEIENADLAKVIVAIAKADGMGWWQRQKLMLKMQMG